MGIEAFVEAASLLAPGWHAVAVENVDFHAPLKFYRDEPRMLTITVLVRPAGQGLVADCALSAERTLPGTDAVTRTTHFTGTVCLARQAPEPETGPPPAAPGRSVGQQDVYRIYFHGPAYQVIEAAWREGDG